MCGHGVKKLEGIAEFCAHPSACKGEGMSSLELGEGCMERTSDRCSGQLDLEVQKEDL